MEQLDGSVLGIRSSVLRKGSLTVFSDTPLMYSDPTTFPGKERFAIQLYKPTTSHYCCLSECLASAQVPIITQKGLLSHKCINHLSTTSQYSPAFKFYTTSLRVLLIPSRDTCTVPPQVCAVQRTTKRMSGLISYSVITESKSLCS